MGGVLVLSLGYSAYLVLAQNADNAFYNSLARFWEIALGGLLATRLLTPARSSAVRQGMGAVGLAAILGSMLTFGAALPFPGLTALGPTVGAALIIHARDSAANRALAWRPLVAIGLISYALYLWHWPIFVFIEYGVVSAQPWHFVLGIIVTIALATISYFVLERPVRTRKTLRTIPWLMTAFAAVIVFQIGIGGLLWQANGAPERFPAASAFAAHLLKEFDDERIARLRDTCWVDDGDLADLVDRCVHPFGGGHNVLIVGDSHAAQFYPAFAAEWPSATINLMAADSCTLRRVNARKICTDLTAWLLTNSANGTLPYDRVIVTARVEEIAGAEVMASVAAEIANNGILVTVLGPIQFYRPNVSLLDTTCPKGPRTCEHLDKEGWPITIDDTHLSLVSAASIIHRVAQTITP